MSLADILNDMAAGMENAAKPKDEQRGVWELQAESVERRQAAKRQRGEVRQQTRAARLRAKDERLAARKGLTVEQVQQGRAVEATRKRRLQLFVGWWS